MPMVIDDLMVRMWRSILRNPDNAPLHEGYLARAALCANRDQLNELALIRPNLVVAVQEFREDL